MGLRRCGSRLTITRWLLATLCLSLASPLALDRVDAPLASLLSPVAAAQPAPAPARARPAITTWGPTSGPPGTTVTVRGARFSPALVIVVAGAPATTTFVDESTLRFRAPDAPGRASVVLRDPQDRGRADQPIGDFVCTAVVSISSFAPHSGPPGTRVEITGLGLEAGDTLRLGAVALIVLSPGPPVIAQIPDGAATGELVVERPRTGQQARTAQPFVVTPAAAPYIASLAPPGGAPGSTVQLVGGNFAPDDAVFYGERPVEVTARSAQALDAIIPPDAQRRERLSVRGPRGTALSPEPYLLGPLTVVRSFEPRSGPPGTRVELLGVGLREVDEARLGAARLPLRGQHAQRLEVEIVPGASSAPFELLARGAVVARSEAPFIVGTTVAEPALRGFTPASGPPGSEVTLDGTALGADARVSYGDQALPIVARRGAEALTVVVPRGATASAPFVVSTRSGTTRSASWFKLELAAVVDSISPTSGPPGTRIAVRGARFGGDEQFFIGAEPAPIASREAWGYVVTAPAGRGGAISFTSGGARVVTDLRFDVAAGITVGGFAPREGLPGTRVTVYGHGVGDALQVSYGGLPCPIVRRARDEVVVVVPPSAAGRDAFWVETDAQRARSADTFHVLPGAPARP
jgi:hypothetical protein